MGLSIHHAVLERAPSSFPWSFADFDKRSRGAPARWGQVGWNGRGRKPRGAPHDPSPQSSPPRLLLACAKVHTGKLDQMLPS